MKKNMNPLAFVLSMGAIAVILPHHVSALETITLNNNDSNSPTFNESNERNVNFIADRDRRKKEVMSNLGLDDSQKTKMREIKSKYKTQIDSIREQITSERQKLAQMMQGNNPTSELRSQHQKVADLGKQMHNLRFEIMLEMREILTTEQRQKLAESMVELRARRKGRLR